MTPENSDVTSFHDQVSHPTDEIKRDTHFTHARRTATVRTLQVYTWLNKTNCRKSGAEIINTDIHICINVYMNYISVSGSSFSPHLFPLTFTEN